MGTAKNIWMYVQAQSPEGLEFNDFVQAQGQAQAQAQASITDRSHAAFAAIDTARATETPENRATVRASALANARSGRNAMPDYQRIHGMKPAGAGAALQFEEGEALDRSAYLAHPATTADLVTD